MDLAFASWNRIASWLGQIDQLKQSVAEASIRQHEARVFQATILNERYLLSGFPARR